MASNKEEEEQELLLIDVQPREGVLVFPHNCFIKLSNTTNKYVAFKFDTTSTHSYTIRPMTGILSPHAKRHVQLMRRAREAEEEAEVCPDMSTMMQCAGKFILLSVVVAESVEDVHVEDEGVVVARELFSKLEGREGDCEHPVHEFEMRVVIPGGCVVSDSNGDEDAGVYEEVKLVEVIADKCVEVSGRGVFGFVGESSRIKNLLVVLFGVLMAFIVIVLGIIEISLHEYVQ